MNSILADIKGFFDHVSHEWMSKFLQHHVGDSRVLRLIQKWLKAGAMADGLHDPQGRDRRGLNS